jgi:NAD(P)-dependent dehydrogenase (short-subunit alcohol dehydrogenase family)
MRGRVLITGAGSGIGRACALYLAEEGFHIIAAGRREEPLAELTKERPSAVEGVQMDVTDPASVEAAIARVSPIDHVVNNAGVAVMGAIEAVPLDEWRRQFEVNVFGVANVCRAVLPQMRQRGGGRIVNIGSVTGRLVPPFQGVYGASKHALEGLSDALRREVEPFGIDVSVIRSSFVNTGFGDQEQESLKKHRLDAYAKWHDRYARWHHQRGHKVAPDPVVVARAVERALTDTNPKTRYACPPSAKRLLLMRALLPAPMVDRMVRRTIEKDSEA